MSKTVILTFTQDQISEHIDRHNGNVVSLATDAVAWCNANARDRWSYERDDTTKLNEPVVFRFFFESDRDATLFMTFHDGATSE